MSFNAPDTATHGSLSLMTSDGRVHRAPSQHNIAEDAEKDARQDHQASPGEGRGHPHPVCHDARHQHDGMTNIAIVRKAF